MDMPNAICLFWGPSQRTLYRDQISKNISTPPISVPYVDQIVNQGKLAQPDPRAVLYIMGFSMDWSDSDNLLFGARPTLADHLAKIRTIFEQYRDLYGCTNFGVKLRPTDSDYRAFKENEQHFQGFKIYFQESSMQLIGQHQFVFTDCLSSSCVEASAMGRDVKYIDFEYEHKSVREQALPVIRDFGISIIRYQDLRMKQPWAKPEHHSQPAWSSNNTSALFKILEDWPKSLRSQAIRELPKHESP
jgi:hypothetical protein